MIKKFVFFLTLYLIIISGSLALAETCPNVVGDWDYNGQQVYYDPETDTYGYETEYGIIHVTNQNGCLFYGHVEIPGCTDCGGPITGAIDGRDVTMTTDVTIVNCTLWCFNVYKGFTKMYCTVSSLSQDSNDSFSTHKGTASRRQFFIGYCQAKRSPNNRLCGVPII